MADRFYRLGRGGDRAGRPRGGVRGRPLHSAGCGADRCEAFCHRASRGQSARQMARTESESGHEARLRSVAAHHRERGETAQGLRHGRRRTGRGRRQPDRRAVERPPGAASGQSNAARHQACRRKRRRQAQAHPGRTEKAARRCAGGVRPAERRLGVQHPRLGRRAYAAGARLRGHSGRGQAVALCRRGQARQQSRAMRWRKSPRCARPAISPTTSRNTKARPCGSIRRARPMR